LFRRTFSFAAVLAALSVAGAAHAQTYTFVTPGGSNDSVGDKVSAEAIFTVGNGTLTIDLQNLLATLDVKDVGQNVSDIYFTFSNSSLNTGSVASSTATFIDINGKGVGSVTISHSQDAYIDKMGWGLDSMGSGAFHLDGLGGKYTPAMTIVGGLPGDMSPYTNSNDSINKGTGPHNPFAQGEADFTLNIAGLTTATQITGATFSFGTTSGDNIVGRPPAPTPEPFTLGFAGFGALLGFKKLRRRS